jgi:hypothetical protein
VRRGIRKLYHLSEANNLASILQHGLMSTECLLDLACVAKLERDVLLRVHRPDNIRLSHSVVIRDQQPMPPAALVRALDDELEPSDWYALLNSFVFLWSDPERMERQRRACGDRPQVVLTFDADALLDRFAAEAFVSPINSGNARRKAARRGRTTFRPYANWLQEGWPTGRRTRPPAEFLLRCTVPAEAPYMIGAAKCNGTRFKT